MTLNKKKPYHSLDDRLYNTQPPTPLVNAQAGHFNTALLKELGLDNDYWQENWVNIISGNMLPDGYQSLAMVYAGHQFGVWAGQLGDGRGLLLSQIEKDNQLWDLHLKGAGRTPYSRMGDGKAVLRSTIREYLAGHALNQLGIASSNALGFVGSDNPVQRETVETAACLLRVADTHIRLGHFEWINSHAPDLLAEFTTYCMEIYYPETLTTAQPILAFAQHVVENTARTIADWQLVGFAHGVMNTDNLSITGSTLDFGPYGFMQRFEPRWINNHSDHTGRYVYQNQPAMAHWNLSVWLQQLLPLQEHHDYIDKTSISRILETYEDTFLSSYKEGIAKKVGLENNEETFNWCMKWLTLMEDEKLDYTNTFRALLTINDTVTQEQLNSQISDADNLVLFQQLREQYNQLITVQGLEDRQMIMKNHNPIYILRNDMVQKAIELAESGDMSEVSRLFDLLSSPHTKQDIATVADTTPPAKNADKICISCSS